MGWRYVWRSSSNHGLFWQNTSLERRRYVCLKGTFRCSTDYFGYNNFFLFKSVIFFTNSTVSSSKLKIELFCVKICKFQFYTAFALCRPREYSLRIWQWCINVCSMNWIMNVQIFKFCSTTSVESLGGWWCSTICIIYYKLFKMKSLNILTLQDHTTSGRCRKALWLWASWDFSDVGYGLWCHILIY